MMPFPWPQAMAFGLGVLKLSPESFWRMTPRELACAMRGIAGADGARLNRAALSELMRRFPDGRSD